MFAKHDVANNIILLLPSRVFMLSRGSGSAGDLIHVILFGFIEWRTTKDNEGGRNLIGYVDKRTDTRDPRHIL